MTDEYVCFAAVCVMFVLVVYLNFRYIKLLAAARGVIARNQQLHEEAREATRKWERVQHGYDQGVLEGTRQAYTNVRAYLTDNIENAEPREQAFLITWLHPRLHVLGQKEHALLMDMKDLTGAEKEFRKTGDQEDES